MLPPLPNLYFTRDAAVVLGERMHWRSFVGGAAILVGLAAALTSGAGRRMTGPHGP